MLDKEDSKHKCISCKYYIENYRHCIPFNKWTDLPVKFTTLKEKKPGAIFREVLNSDGLCPHFVMSEEVKEKIKDFAEELERKITSVKKEINGEKKSIISW